MADKSWGKYDPRWNDINPDVWNLKDEFTVVEAAALIASIDPSAITYSVEKQTVYSINYTDDTRPVKAPAVFHSLIKAITDKELNAKFPEKKDHFPFDDYEDIPF